MSIATEREERKSRLVNLSQMCTGKTFQKDSNTQEGDCKESPSLDPIPICIENIIFQIVLEEKDITTKEIDTILSSTTSPIAELMCSKEAKYFTQKLFKKLSPSLRLTLLKIIKPSFINICMDQFGNHSIQELISSIQSMQEWQIIESYISQDLQVLFFNENSHNVIQKIILSIPEKNRHDLNTFVLQNIVHLSLNEFGSLCVLKFMKENRNAMIKKILINQLNREEIFSQLISDQYGSCVMNNAISIYGIFNFINLFEEINVTSIIYLCTLNETAVNFILQFFRLVNKFDKDFYNKILLAPQKRFVKAS